MPKPAGNPTLTPYLVVQDAQAAIDFYGAVFGARERMRLSMPGGRIAHAELELGDSLLMLADEHPGMGALAPQPGAGTSVSIHIYVDDVDAVFVAAVKAGATVTRPVADQFYGDRAGGLRDPFGHSWHLATHIEDVPPEEMQRRMAELEKPE